MLARVEVVPVIGRKMVDSAIEVTLVSGEVLMADVPMARGHPSRPLSRDELSAKFVDCAESRLGRVALDVLDLLGQFPAGDTFARALRLVHAQSPA